MHKEYNDEKETLVMATVKSSNTNVAPVNPVLLLCLYYFHTKAPHNVVLTHYDSAARDKSLGK
jgi:hypothetical protein